MSSPVFCILCLQGGCEPHPGEELGWRMLKCLTPAQTGVPWQWHQASGCHRSAKEEPPRHPTPACSPTLGHRHRPKPRTAGLRAQPLGPWPSPVTKYLMWLNLLCDPVGPHLGPLLRATPASHTPLEKQDEENGQFRSWGVNPGSPSACSVTLRERELPDLSESHLQKEGQETHRLE